MLQRKFEGVSFSNAIYQFPNWKWLSHDRFVCPRAENVAWKRSHGFRAFSLNMESRKEKSLKGILQCIWGSKFPQPSILKDWALKWTLSDDNDNKNNRRWTLFWRRLRRRWVRATPRKKLHATQPEHRPQRQQWPWNMLLKKPLFCHYFPQAFCLVLFHF